SPIGVQGPRGRSRGPQLPHRRHGQARPFRAAAPGRVRPAAGGGQVNDPPGWQGFSHVDASADPALLVSYLDDASRLPVLRAVDRKLAGTLRLAPGSAVLDVGCGTGADTVALADLVSPGGRAVGVDVSAVMIEEARRRAARRDRSVEFRVGR